MVRYLVPSCAAFCLVIPSAAGAAAPAEPEVLVGVLTEQADLLCNGTSAPEWVRPHFEVGFVEVVPRPGLNLDSWLGKTVRIVGGRVAPPGAPPQHTGPCPPEQMRSDYVRSRQGIRIKRPNDSRPGAFRADAVEPFGGLEAKLVKGGLFVKLTNQLGRPLLKPEIRVHYEGCYKKPLGLRRGQVKPALPVAKAIEARFEPWVADSQVGPAGAEHVATAVQVLAGEGPVVFDLDLPLAKLGLLIECRKRL